MSDSEPDTLAVQKKSKKHLSFCELRQAMTGYLDTMPDPIQSRKCDCSVHDTVMSAFACMYFQDPSLKQFQESLRRHKYLEDYQVLPSMLLCVMDGNQYHSLKSIHCPYCLHEDHQDGERPYNHAVLQGL